MENLDVIDLIKNKYLSNHKENTLRHVEEVADTAVWLAKIYNLDIVKVRLAALLHDISAIMTPQEMYELATTRGLEIDAAEEKYHFLLHQRISKIIAQEDFDISDSDILDAIECHTTLKKNASMYDKVIFIADKISWDQKGKPPYLDILKSKVVESLDEACYFYIKYQFDNNLLLMPHQWIIEAFEDLRKHKEKGNKMDIVLFNDNMQKQLDSFFEKCFSAVGIPYSPKDRHADIADVEQYYMKNGCFWCLLDNDCIIGTVAIRIIDNVNQIVELKRMFVLPEYQGKGYGRLLLEYAITYSREQHYQKMCLDTRKQFSAAQHLYRSVGFQETDRYNDNEHAELYFELVL